MNEAIRKNKVIYIVGEGHSGSTATDFLLGRIVGHSCGQLAELGYMIDEKGLPTQLANDREGLGTWSAFLKAAPQECREAYHWMFQEILHERHVLSYFLFPSARIRYAEEFDSSVKPIFDYCESTTIIDSSKNISRALGISRSQVCEIILVHLIRSPIGFLTSVLKRNEAGPDFGSQMYWALHWLAKNILAFCCRRFYGKQCVGLVYEALYSDPHSSLGPLFALLGVEIQRHEFDSVVGETRPPPATVGGNRIRTAGSIVFERKKISQIELQAIHPAVLIFCQILERLFLPSVKRLTA